MAAANPQMIVPTFVELQPADTLVSMVFVFVAVD